MLRYWAEKIFNDVVRYRVKLIAIIQIALAPIVFVSVIVGTVIFYLFNIIFSAIASILVFVTLLLWIKN
jgi:hypothetical protein